MRIIVSNFRYRGRSNSVLRLICGNIESLVHATAQTVRLCSKVERKMCGKLISLLKTIIMTLFPSTPFKSHSCHGNSRHFVSEQTRSDTSDSTLSALKRSPPLNTRPFYDRCTEYLRPNGIAATRSRINNVKLTSADAASGRAQILSRVIERSRHYRE